MVVPTGHRLHRMSSFHDRVMWNTSPPRVRIEEALIDVFKRLLWLVIGALFALSSLARTGPNEVGVVYNGGPPIPAAHAQARAPGANDAVVAISPAEATSAISAFC